MVGQCGTMVVLARSQLCSNHLLPQGRLDFRWNGFVDSNSVTATPLYDITSEWKLAIFVVWKLDMICWLVVSERRVMYQRALGTSPMITPEQGAFTFCNTA